MVKIYNLYFLNFLHLGYKSFFLRIQVEGLYININANVNISLHDINVDESITCL